MIPNNNTGTGANDGNCPLYPGVFMSNPTQGNHTYRTVDMTPNGIFQGYRWWDLHNVSTALPVRPRPLVHAVLLLEPDADARLSGR